MLERTTRIVSENLARSISRRSFLTQVTGALFAGVATVASGHLFVSDASAAAGRAPRIPTIPPCTSPGPWCNLDGNGSDPNGCHGSSCFQHMVNGLVLQCRLWYDMYQSGCWTTPVSGGYWVCCDCQCTGGHTCGCAQYSGNIRPRPDGHG